MVYNNYYWVHELRNLFEGVREIKEWESIADYCAYIAELHEHRPPLEGESHSHYYDYVKSITS